MKKTLTVGCSDGLRLDLNACLRQGHMFWSVSTSMCVWWIKEARESVADGK